MPLVLLDRDGVVAVNRKDNIKAPAGSTPDAKVCWCTPAWGARRSIPGWQTMSSRVATHDDLAAAIDAHLAEWRQATAGRPAALVQGYE